jgi:membrane protein
LIILVGAQVSFFVQHPAAYRARFLWQQDSPAIRERLVLEIMTTLGRRHLRGDGPMGLTGLANELGLPPAVLEDRVIQLVDQGLLAQVAEPEGIGLVKPPELIALEELLRLVHEGQGVAPDSSQKPGDPIDKLIRRRDAAVAESLDGMTLRSLIVGREETPAKPGAGIRD